MEMMLNQSFSDKTVVFDGCSFTGCTFTDCVVVISTPDFHFERCTFDRVKFLLAPSLSITDLSYRLSECPHRDIACFWNDVYLDAETLAMLRQEMIG